MTKANTPEPPVEKTAGKLNEGTVEALKVLGDRTRIAILLALWEEYDSSEPPSIEKPELSFAELRERVGVADSGRFNYHLDKLTDIFIEKTDAGYRPLYFCIILYSLMSRQIAEPQSFENRPIDATCWRCGAPVVIDYRDSCLFERCTNCEGVFHFKDDLSGVIAVRGVPSGTLEYHDPEELHQRVSVLARAALESRIEGICPDCYGPVSANLHVCSDHDESTGAPCERCGSIHELTWLFTCDICKVTNEGAGFIPVLFDSHVLRFFAKHGLDVRAHFDASKKKPIYDPIQRVKLKSSEPPEVEVVFELDGDRLGVTYDGEANLINITEVID